MGNINKLFSIILCAYNAEGKLEKALESIFAQENLSEYVKEIILVDNNSKDETGNIMRDFTEKCSIAKYVFEGKQGLSNARLAGINNSSGQWLIFVDDDNVLDNRWISKAKEYLEKNEKVGAFNGAVIPKVDEYLDKNEQMTLEVVLKGLACTHISEDKIDYNSFVHPYGTPFGAGLVILAEPIRELVEKGWVKSEGRKGNILSSGEDNEMCGFVKTKGYDFGFNPNMKIDHLINKSRLDKEYLTRLYLGFGNVNYMEVKDKSIVNRITFIIISALKFIIRTIQQIFIRDYKKNLKYFLTKQCFRGQIKIAIKDLF